VPERKPRKYQPAALIKFTIQLEDFAEVTNPDTESEQKPFRERAAKLDESITRARGLLATAQNSQKDGRPISVEVSRRRRVLRSLEKSRQILKKQPPTPAALPTDQGNDFTIVVYVAPISLTVEINSFRIADTVIASFPFLDAPFYSYTIRSAFMDVFMGTMPVEEFGKPDAWVLPLDRATLMFRGYVDSWETTHDDADAMVQVQARSYESVLMDAKVNPLAKAHRIAGQGEKISDYVNRILSQFPQTSGKFGDQMRAVWYGAAADQEPVLDRKRLLRTLQTAKSRNETLGQVQIPEPNGQQVAPDADTGGTDPGATTGVAGSPQVPSGSPGQDMSVWDLLTQACELAGCIPIYDPSLPAVGGVDPVNSILLRPPQTIYEDVLGGARIRGGPIDGFSREFTNPRSQFGVKYQSEIRLMVWGHNVKSLKTSRKLGKIKAQAVEVVSYNPDAAPKDRTITVRYPDIKRPTWTNAKGGSKIDQVFTKVVRGVRDRDLLKQIAVSIFHQITRQEVGVVIETDDLASYIDPTTPVDPNEKTDILKLRAGTPVRVNVARERKELNNPGAIVISPLSNMFEKRSDEIIQFLKRQNARFERNANDARAIERVAVRLARAFSSARLTDVFYCRSVSHKFEADGGYSATMELVNYLEARSDAKNLGKLDQQANDQRKTHKLAKSEVERRKEAAAKTRANVRRAEQERRT
jgi:hypothetical protein